MYTHELIDAIKAYKPVPKAVEVKAWGKTVYVKPLTTEQYLALRDNADIPLNVKVVVAGVCGPEGDNYFTKDHIPVLCQAVAGPVMELADEILNLTNGISDTDAKNS